MEYRSKVRLTSIVRNAMLYIVLLSLNMLSSDMTIMGSHSCHNKRSQLLKSDLAIQF